MGGDTLQRSADILLLFPFLPQSYSLVFFSNCVLLALAWITVLLCVPLMLIPSMAAVRENVFHVAFYPVLLFSTVLYLPALGIAGLGLKCDVSVLHVDNSVGCFSPSHLPLVGVSFATIIGFGLVSVWHKTFVFPFESISQCEGSKQGQTFDLLFHLIRSAVTLVVLLSYEDVSSFRNITL